MTEYGRGQGSEPWHPADPLYGDQGWGQQAGHGRPAHGGQGQYDPQQSQQSYGGDWGTDGGGQPGYGQDPYAQDPYGQQQYGQQQYGGQQYGGQQGQGGWDTGQQGQMPYGTDPADPYGTGQHATYGGEEPDYYQTPGAYPPPEPPGRRRAPEPEPETEWDAGPDQGEHAFFNGDDGDDDGFEDDSRAGRRGKGKGGKKPKKRRSGCACLVLTVIFAAGVGGVGYFGYQFYQDRFGSAPDYAGGGNGETVTVVIPKGAGGYVIGQKLKQAGVVQSVDAFVAAQQENKSGTSIQDGAYVLQKEMSAASAVDLLLSPKSRANLIVREGWRNSLVYAEIDKKLNVAKGTTAKVAKEDYKELGLPGWAEGHAKLKDPLEGFLYPSSYAAAKGMKPADVLKQMVERSTENYKNLGIESKAKALHLDDPWQVLTVASLVQAEGKTHDDFRKMAEVVYNRLKTSNTETNQLLQFDSTFNYLKRQSKINIGESEINSNKDPYNTYTRKGLPPGPIGNPGDEALRATLAPTKDGWMYFVATDGMHKTEFAKTNAEFERLKAKFNDSQGN
ncbi:endolytic transglycosylase MltG [Streptomyces sp. SID5785]|uniref:endolytic transglycosylase MltG n=1 Tax=Streptomyces sp. SID5785 TaxID=2690309 RepID=UPI0013616CC8|nr:endolytic transglycosylase MltG [Streptomyces sp. SID5785]MZD03821.1 endolytic transglycosylase MltG [Streptomyces sp. SID5785]